MMFDEFPKLAGGAWVVDPTELKETFLFLTSIYQDIHHLDLSNYRIEIQDADGNPHLIHLEDTPINRVLLALRDWLHEEPVEKYISITWRVIALTQLIKSGILDEWVMTAAEDESLKIPGSIIYVAATLPLEHTSGFDPDLFTETVREITISGL